MLEAQTEAQTRSLLSYSRASYRMGIAATKHYNLLGSKYTNMIFLGQGIPSFPTPEHIKEAAIKAIVDNKAGKYTPGYGIDPLREAIAQKVRRYNKINAEPKQVIVTAGGIEAVQSTFLTLLNPEDELIALTPDYASHFNQIIIATGGREAIQVPLTETADDWVVDPQRLEDAVTDHTKAILITNPCNPTGKVYSEGELKEVAQVALRHNLYIIADEMYEYFAFDERKHTSIGSFPEVAGRTISVFGLSKSYAMTGWRVGYVVAGQETIGQIFKFHDSLVTCAAAVSQYAALAAIEGPQDVVEGFRGEFDKRRQIVMEELAGTNNMTLQLPQGAYYAFPRIAGNVDDRKFVMSLIEDEEAGVVVIPGSAFGKGGESHIRISFGGEEQELREGLQRFKGYLNRIVSVPRRGFEPPRPCGQ